MSSLVHPPLVTTLDVQGYCQMLVEGGGGEDLWTGHLMSALMDGHTTVFLSFVIISPLMLSIPWLDFIVCLTDFTASVYRITS